MATSAILVPQAQRLRALVVDHSPAARAALCAYVQRDELFLVVETAAHADEALRRARDCAPDLVVIDFDIPECNGLYIAQEMLREIPSLSIVMVSLDDSAELRQRCQEIGVRACVAKAKLGRELPPVLKQIYLALST